MSGGFCPTCGVAVVPGYVRCPKCHAPLPGKKGAHVEGGTAVETRSSFPFVPLIAAVAVAGGIIAFFALRAPDHPPARPVPPARTAQTAPASDTPASASAAAPPASAQPAGPDAGDLAEQLERALKKQRLWSTVAIVADRVEIRSGSCADPGMAPLLDGVAASFKAAGLTGIRCLEQSGRVVTDREL